MIDWIKFSERQPEKEGRYLCYDDGDSYILEWMDGPIFGSRFHDPYIDDFNSANCEPEYWAEINPPQKENPLNDPIPCPKCKEFFCGHPLTQKETPMPEKPLCKDCKWIKPPVLERIENPLADSRCSHPKAPRSLVNGEPAIEAMCWCLRGPQLTAGGILTEPETCGPEGRWFEEKQEGK